MRSWNDTEITDGKSHCDLHFIPTCNPNLNKGGNLKIGKVLKNLIHGLDIEDTSTVTSL